MEKIKDKIYNEKWKYYHYSSKCLERDSNYEKLRNNECNEEIEP